MYKDQFEEFVCVYWGLKGLTGFYCIELLCVTMIHIVCRDNDWKSLNVLLFLPIYHFLFLLDLSVQLSSVTVRRSEMLIILFFSFLRTVMKLYRKQR